MINSVDYGLKMCRALRLDSEKLERTKLVKLNRLLTKAYRETTYYRDLYKHNCPKLNHTAELEKVPINQADNFRRQANKAITVKQQASYSELIQMQTSGSSSAPFRFYVSARELRQRQMKIMRLLWLHGWRPWWRGLSLETEEPGGGSWFDKIIRLRKHRVSIHRQLEQQARQIVSFRPQLLYGVTSSIERVAEWIIDHQLTLPAVGLVMGMGETIDQNCEKKFVKAFGHPGINLFGSSECGVMGWSCPFCHQFHFDDDGIIAELIDLKPSLFAGEKKARLLITVLDQTTTPIIRYELGDIVNIAPPGCCSGVGFSRFSGVAGRRDDFIEDRQGRLFIVSEIVRQMQTCKAVSRIQFVKQTEADRLHVRYVPVRDNELAESELRAKLSLILDLNIRLTAHKNLPLENSGKFQLLAKE